MKRWRRDKAAWYLARGVEVVWLVFPGPRRVAVSTPSGAADVTGGALPEHPSLPGLAPSLDELFAQLDSGSTTPT